MTAETASAPPPRAFVISVKHTDGDWVTYTALEAKVAQPFVVASDVGGVVTIRCEGDKPIQGGS